MTQGLARSHREGWLTTVRQWPHWRCCGLFLGAWVPAALLAMVLSAKFHSG